MQGPAATANFFVGRQPILDASESTYAYELLFRSTGQNSAQFTDGGAATDTVLNTVMNVMGLTSLVDDHWAFINVTEETLIKSTYNVLPRERVVIELLEDVRPTPDIIDACECLKSRGYKLALDDYATRDDYDKLLALADFVKVDFMNLSPDERSEVTRNLRQFPAELLAEKVETYEDVEQAKELGYRYFQGYYYQKPDVLETEQMAPSLESCLRLLQALNHEPFDVSKIEKVIKQDPALATRLLCYINSAYFGLRSQVSSIAHALKLLGSSQIRKWGSLVAVEQLSEEHPAELMRNCLIRGLFCEMLGKVFQLRNSGMDLYLTGLLSLIDVLTKREKKEVVRSLDLKPEITGALLGEQSELADVLRMAESCEKSQIELIHILTSRYQIDHETLYDLHRHAIKEARMLAA